MQALAIEAIDSLIEWLIWPALLHSLWIGLLVASIVALVFQAGARLSHQARHGILLASLGLTILGPAVATLCQQGIASRSKDCPEPESVIPAVVDAGNRSPDLRTMRPTPVVPYRANGASLDRYIILLVGGLASFADTVRRVRLFLVAAWLLGIALCAGLLGLGTRALRRLRQEADLAPEPIRARARALARLLRLNRAPPVLVHPHIDEPCLIGLFQPSIILPARWLAGNRADLLDAILSHELAHARRLDHVVNLAQRLVETLLFFHPAVHWMSRSLRRQREFCADMLSVRVTRDPLALAQALESVALFRFSSPAPRLAGTSLGGQTTSLLPRIEELLGMKPTRPRTPAWPLVAIPAAGLFALVAASAGVAQQSIPRRLPAERSVSGEPEDQLISYEVRYMSVDAEPWRDCAKDRITLVHQETDVCAWIVDDKVMLGILTLVQNTATSNVLQAPKAVALQGVPVTLSNSDKHYYVAQIEKLENVGNPAYRPIVKNIDVGVRMELNGTLEARSTILSFDVHDTSLLAMHTLVRKDQVGEKAFAMQYQIPTSVERRCHAKYEIPDGSSLVVSLGVHERRGRSSDPTEAASELLRFVGLPPVPARSVTCERLVVIRPRRVVLPAGKHSSKEHKSVRLPVL